MADRTSAKIFGEVFKYLAGQEPSKGRDDFAAKMWDMSQEHDFSNYQMGCDKALIELGLAKMGVHPQWPEDGEVVLYRGDGA